MFSFGISRLVAVQSLTCHKITGARPGFAEIQPWLNEASSVVFHADESGGKKIIAKPNARRDAQRDASPLILSAFEASSQLL